MSAGILEHLTVQRVKAITLIGGLDVQAIKRIGSELRAPVMALRDVLSGLCVAQEIRAVGNCWRVSLNGSNGRFRSVIVQFEVIEDAPCSCISSFGLDADAKRAVRHLYGNGIPVLATIEGITCALAIGGIGAIGNVLQERLGTTGIKLCHDAFACSSLVEALGAKLIDATRQACERLMDVVVRDARLLADVVAPVASPIENLARRLPLLAQAFP